ncbi:M1 family metallopeptidase [Phenylobacterium sp.]|uniref:M1 family metallopeptidase n=1 Tax=Phenylobacterium sp. TaxID=1871053 RepID=UPI003BA8E166
MKLFALATALVLGALPAQAAVQTQLPAGVEPVAYDLTVTPDAKALTFKGQVRITLTTARPTDRVVLNAADLTFAQASLDGAPAKVTTDPEAQTATFALARPLKAGRHVLAVSYAGKINEGPAGLFHVDYDGGRMLMTQFEPADGRRFAPMFDEPAKKAVWTVSAVVPATQMALSNMPQSASTPLAGGLKKVRFAPTPKMSSYLLFFGLGDLERISAQVDGTTVGVVMRKGDTANGRYALEAATQLLAYYNGYFGVKYPLPKLDLIGAPGEAAGAMENWGAILYTQSYIVVDPKLSTAADRQTVFNVVAHEMAHQWFGDLVTMAWWDDLWLNEGFANWMAVKASDHFHPEWRPLLTAQADKDDALKLDSKASTHPVVQTINTVAQAEQAFDAITYQKGEAVIRMLEGYAGPDAWRDGVRAYMAAHAYGNTASRDLWAAIDKAAGKPISAIAHDFTLQPGVPLIALASGSPPTLSQGRFGTDEASKAPLTWRVPVRAAPVTGLGSAIISGAAPQTMDGLVMPAVLNAGQTGYYRSLYDAKAFALVAGQMGKWEAADQIGLLDDGLALGLAGYAPVGNYLQLAAALPASADPLVWRRAADGLAGLDGYFDPGPGRDAYRAWVLARLAPVLSRVGFDARAGEADNEAILRETLLTALIALDSPAVLAEARRRFEATGHDLSKLDASARSWVLPGVVQGADAATFETLRGLARASRDPLEKQQLYELLAGVQDAALAQRVLDLAITDEPPTNVGPRLIAGVSNEHPDLAWRFTLANLPAISKGFDALRRNSFVPGIAGRSKDAARAEELLAFAAANIPADAQGDTKVAVARIRYGAEIKARRVPEISAWIAAQGR